MGRFEATQADNKSSFCRTTGKNDAVRGAFVLQGRALHKGLWDLIFHIRYTS